MSANGTNIKYSDRDWKPDLDSIEWGIVNYVVDNHQGVELTEKTDYFYRNYKGKKLFGIYSTDDNTLLYAVHEDDADDAYSFLLECIKEEENEKNLGSGAGNAASRIKNIWLRQVNSAINNASPKQLGKNNGNVTIHGSKSRIYADAALRNVVENIFNESSRDTGISYQDRLSISDANRLEILENQEERLVNDLKTLEKYYGDAIRQVYEQDIKIMCQAM